MEKHELNAKLHRFIKSFPDRTFQRGLTDCCAFSAHWAKALCGTLPAEHLLNRRLTDKQAFKILKDAGGLSALVSDELARLGWESVEHPQTGDIVVIQSSTGFGGSTVGVWSGSSMVTIHEKGGVATEKPPTVERAWRWE